MSEPPERPPDKEHVTYCGTLVFKVPELPLNRTIRFEHSDQVKKKKKLVKNIENVSLEEAANYFEKHNCKCKQTQEAVLNGIEAANKLKLWYWFSTYEPPEATGYMFTDNPNIDAMAAETDSYGHSGATFGFVMRYLKGMAEEMSALDPVSKLEI